MFRGKESSNRIKLSQLVQALLNFGVLVSLRLWGWGVVGGAPTHMHMHTHACMVNMIISCKWLLPLGESLGIPYDVIHACVHMRMHVCMCACMHVRVCAYGKGAPSHHPPPPFTHPPTHPPRGTLESFKI